MTTNHEHLREVALWHRQEVDALLEDGYTDVQEHLSMASTIESAIDELAELRKENEGLKADAERYREALTLIRDDAYSITWAKGVAEQALESDAARAAIGDSHE